MFFSVPQIAQPLAAAPSSSAQWFPEWSAPYCTISTGNPKDLALSIWHVPGSAGLEIYFMGAGGVRDIGSPGPDPGHGPLARIAELNSGMEAFVEMGTGRPIPVTLLGTAPSSTNVLGFAVSGDDFFGNFAGSTELFVRQKLKSFGMHYSGADEATNALKRCTEAKLREWRVDPDALAALKRFPVLRYYSWVRYEDFPREALAKKQGGTVVVRLTTDESGKVTSCAVALSSGVTSLDNVTCRVALQRARYKPAIGPDGRRISATFINYAKFEVLP